MWIAGNECCERLAYYGIATNLVTYLTQKLHQGNVSAARNVTTWQGTCYLTPLIGAVLADAYWGRYWTIAVFSMIYVIVITKFSLSNDFPHTSPSWYTAGNVLHNFIEIKQNTCLPYSEDLSGNRICGHSQGIFLYYFMLLFLVVIGFYWIIF